MVTRYSMVPPSGIPGPCSTGRYEKRISIVSRMDGGARRDRLRQGRAGACWQEALGEHGNRLARALHAAGPEGWARRHRVGHVLRTMRHRLWTSTRNGESVDLTPSRW